MSIEDDALVGLTLGYAATKIKPAVDAARKRLNQGLIPSERRAVRHPVTGEVLGFVTRTKPNPVARVEDESVLLPWIAENRPDDLADVEEIVGTEDEVRAVLAQHAPGLIRASVRISPQGLNAVLKQSESDPEFRPPGIVVVAPQGTTNFYYENPDGVESLIASGLIALDGTVRPQLAEGTSDDAQNA